jgi:hypothetical protein
MSDHCMSDHLQGERRKLSLALVTSDSAVVKMYVPIGYL